jgi:hypothetical protein
MISNLSGLRKEVAQAKNKVTRWQQIEKAQSELAKHRTRKFLSSAKGIATMFGLGVVKELSSDSTSKAVSTKHFVLKKAITSWLQS